MESQQTLSEIRVAGGGASSNAWCQMKADVMSVPMVRTSHRETGLIGAAIAAAVGLGWHPTVAAAADAMCPIERVFEPRSGLAPFYAQRAERYDRARQHAIAEADAARSPSTRTARARACGSGSMNTDSDSTGFLATYGTALAALILFCIFAVAAPNFLNPTNLLNVLKQISFLAILGLGFGLALITGELDLSFANVCSFAAVVVGGLIHHGHSPAAGGRRRAWP